MSRAVLGSAAITGHSVRGESRIRLTRSTRPGIEAPGGGTPPGAGSTRGAVNVSGRACGASGATGDAGSTGAGAAAAGAIVAPQLPQKRAPAWRGLPHCGQNIVVALLSVGCALGGACARDSAVTRTIAPTRKSENGGRGVSRV